MRAGISTILQTLTPEAATVLNQSIADASLRHHGQTTPLHVAAILLASPSGFLRRACIRSHPNSSHPLQCRALELCFSVALERLPTATAPTTEPPISNALMAALKRAQAHQRRGCPEQQQQPLLALKVELEQIIISILDDPSVSRVMREASFSSPVVKATIEQSLTSNSSNTTPPKSVSPVGLSFRTLPAPCSATRNPYLNPWLQQKIDEVERVTGILGRAKRRNPVIVGDSEPGRVIRDVLKKIEDGEQGNLPVNDVKVVHLDETNTDKAVQIRELDGLLETQIGNPDPGGGGGVIIDLGDLKWLLEQPQASSGATHTPHITSKLGRTVVADLKRLLEKFEGRLWFIGRATCDTYLRCQVYHPTMEDDWDLQAVPIAAKAPPLGNFPRMIIMPMIVYKNRGNFDRLGNKTESSVESFTPSKSFVALNKGVHCCPQCLQNYHRELSILGVGVASPEVKGEAAQSNQLPPWLLKANVEPAHQSKEKVGEVQKKWNDICMHLHPSFHCKTEKTVPVPIKLTYGPSLLLRQPLQAKRDLGHRVRLKPMSPAREQAKSPPHSLVRTDLALGRLKDSEKPEEMQVRDFLGCLSSESPQDINKISVVHGEHIGKSSDIDLFKKLLKGLTEKVWWQHDAASAVATSVSHCKLGNGNHRGVWLLFSGPDRVGKRKMAWALSSIIYGTSPTIIPLGSRRDDGESSLKFRGKTALDRIAETVKTSPFCVIMLEDMDEADMLLHGSMKQAMEKGRLSDSHGREINLRNVIFIVTASWHPTDTNTSFSDEDVKLQSLGCENWRIRLRLREKSGKRRPNWLNKEEDRPTKPKKEHGSMLSFDLNEAAEGDDDRNDGCYDTSNQTTDEEQKEQGFSSKLSLRCVPIAFHELVSRLDDAVAFRAVDLSIFRRKIAESITERFRKILGESISVEIEDEALERIVGGVWLGKTGLEEWLDTTVVPSLNQLKSRVSSLSLSSSGIYSERTVVGLELEEDSGEESGSDLLSKSITLAV